MINTIFEWMLSNWIIVTFIVSFLGWIAKGTKWEWDDKAIEWLKLFLNLVFPGKKLYSLEEMQEKGIDKLIEEERQYKNTIPRKRIKEECMKRFTKKQH